MKRIYILIIPIMAFLSASADGILLPDSDNYPQQFVKNLFTDVTLNIHDNIVETIVYQEFYNDYDLEIDAVWNFPLPADARTTKLLYWYNDTCYEAILKVAQQTTNPGTGDGGIAAEVNNYIGTSGIKLELHHIPAHEIQKIELHYISLLDYSNGSFIYSYPLNTSDFIEGYINYLNVNINVENSTNITGWDFPSYNDYTSVLYQDNNNLQIQMTKDKVFLAEDFTFEYQIDQQTLEMDFYSNYCDTMDSHFGVFVKPPLEEIPERIYYKKITFLIGNSSSMAGSKIQQSVSAVSAALDSLRIGEKFNIAFYNNNIDLCSTEFMGVNTENLNSARNYMDDVSLSGGSDLNTSLIQTLDLYDNDAYQNCIMVFTDGYSNLDAELIQSWNDNNTTIVFVAVDKEVSREKIELTASLNYGFVNYAYENNNIQENFMRAFNRINLPIIKNVEIGFNKTDISSIVHQPNPSVFVGSWFYLTGRYVNSSTNDLDISGDGVLGFEEYNFSTTYTDNPYQDFFIRNLWAKSVIDELEWQIMTYGEDQTLKDSLIALSLSYKIKCRYTAYFQLEEHIYGGETFINDFESKYSNIITAYPNPFDDILKIDLEIPERFDSNTKLIKIYNSVGLLIKIIDISDLKYGKHKLELDTSEFNPGMYIISLQISNKPVCSQRVIKK